MIFLTILLFLVLLLGAGAALHRGIPPSISPQDEARRAIEDLPLSTEKKSFFMARVPPAPEPHLPLLVDEA
ncbi:MAG: hypothetical protein H6Q00_1609 [Holophagaceae bacterium]|nr:hypothetical protein [Holophagaceae bacterium]